MECIHREEQRYHERTTEVESEHWSSLDSGGTFQFSPALTHFDTRAPWIFTPNPHFLIELQSRFYSLQTIKPARVTAIFLTIYILYWWNQRIGPIKGFVLPRPQKERRVFIHQRPIDLPMNHLYAARQCGGRSRLQGSQPHVPDFPTIPTSNFCPVVKVCPQLVAKESTGKRAPITSIFILSSKQHHLAES